MRWEETKTVRPSPGQILEQVANPVDPFRVETVHGLVQEKDAWITQERGRDTKSLPHAQGELAHPLAGDLGKSHHLDEFIHPPAPDTVSLREREQMIVRGAAGVDRASLEQRSHLAEWSGVVPAVLSVQPHVARRWARRGPG